MKKNDKNESWAFMFVVTRLVTLPTLGNEAACSRR